MAEFQKLSEVDIIEKLSTETNVLVEDAGDVKKIRSSLFKHETSGNGNGSGRIDGMIFRYSAPINSSDSSSSSYGSSHSIDYKYVLSKSLPVFDSEVQLLSFLNGNGKAYDFYGNEMTLLTAKQVFDYTLNAGIFIVNDVNLFIGTKDDVIAELKTIYPDIDDYNTLINILYTDIGKSFMYGGYCNIDNNNEMLTVRYCIYGNYLTHGSDSYNTQMTFSGELNEWL